MELLLLAILIVLVLILITLVAAFLPGVFWFIAIVVGGLLALLIAGAALVGIFASFAAMIRGIPAFFEATPAFFRGWSRIVLSPFVLPGVRWRELRSETRPNGKQGLILAGIEVGYTFLVTVFMGLLAIMFPIFVGAALIYQVGRIGS